MTTIGVAGWTPLLALALALPLTGQVPPRSGEALTVHPEARAAIEGIRSPYCPGQMLEVCTSSGGAMLRDSIQRMAEVGLSADSIIELVIAEYGEQWRAEPLRTGTSRWVWYLPPILIAGGLGMVAGLLMRRGGVPDIRDAKVVPEDAARLRDAIEELEEAEAPDW